MKIIRRIEAIARPHFQSRATTAMLTIIAINAMTPWFSLNHLAVCISFFFIICKLIIIILSGLEKTEGAFGSGHRLFPENFTPAKYFLAAWVRALQIAPDTRVAQKHNNCPRICPANSYRILMSRDACHHPRHCAL
jgi:hypothetical protein